MTNEMKETVSKNIITFHEAFPYFAKDLGLNIISTIEDGENTAHSPKELSEIIDLDIEKLIDDIDAYTKFELYRRKVLKEIKNEVN